MLVAFVSKLLQFEWARHARWLHALFECAATCISAAQRLRTSVSLGVGMSTQSISARALLRAVSASLQCCACARTARFVGAVVSQCPRNAERRAVKQIAMARCALTMLAATVCTKHITSHCHVKRRTRCYRLTPHRRAWAQRCVIASCAPVLRGGVLAACVRAYRHRCAVVASAFANCLRVNLFAQSWDPPLAARGANHWRASRAAYM